MPRRRRRACGPSWRASGTSRSTSASSPAPRPSCSARWPWTVAPTRATPGTWPSSRSSGRGGRSRSATRRRWRRSPPRTSPRRRGATWGRPRWSSCSRRAREPDDPAQGRRAVPLGTVRDGRPHRPQRAGVPLPAVAGAGCPRAGGGGGGGGAADGARPMMGRKTDAPSRAAPSVTPGPVGLSVLALLSRRSRGVDGPAPAAGAAEALVVEFGVTPCRLTGSCPTGLARSLGDFPHPWVTIVTSMFLHGGLFHIGGNMLYLWIFGNNVEDTLGHGRFLLFYLASAVA